MSVHTNRRAFLTSLLAALGLSRFVETTGQSPAYVPIGEAPRYSPQLYQARTSINWRAVVDDDLAIFHDISSRIADAQNRTMSDMLTQFAEHSGFTWGATKDGDLSFTRISGLAPNERRFNPSRLPA